MRLIVAFTVCLFVVSCKQEQATEQAVAQVFESVLYPSDIADFIPKGASPEDSTVLAQNYIRTWVSQKLLLQKAIENLSGEQKEIQKQVEDYRTSLLIHQYKQKLIAQRLQDEVKDTEVEEYYRENEKNFILSTAIVKAVFFVVPKNAPNMKEVRKWFLSTKEEDRENLEDYCLTNARKYDKFNDSWVEVKYLLNLMPDDAKELERDILGQKHIEKEDESNYYFLNVYDVKREQTLAPLDYVREEIVLILKNKKKLKFENDLERQINEEGVRKNYVKIY